MQSMAVLLLEMAYEGQNLKEAKDDILACIKKLMSWLRSMRDTDPVASRAHSVVYKILNTCAPGLRAQVKELMDDDHGHPSQPEPPEASQSTTTQSQPESWDTPSEPIYPPGSSQTFQQFLPEQLPDSVYPYPVQYDQSMAFSFGNPFMTTFDQGPPIVDMQNLWWQPTPSDSLSLGPYELVMPQQQQQQIHGQITQETQQNDWTQQPDIDDELDHASQQ
jgi:hypothetical protein